MIWRLTKIFSYLLLGLLLLVGLAVAAGGWLLHSQEGTRQLLEFVQEQIPGALDIGGVSGRLTGPLELRDVLYNEAGLRFSAKRLVLDWKPSALSERTLHVRELGLEGGRMALPPAEEESSGGFSGFALPFKALVDKAYVTDFHLELPDSEAPLIIEQGELSASAEGEKITLRRFAAALMDAQAEAKGEVTLSAKLPLDVQLTWKYAPPDLTALSGEGTIQGNLEKLELVQSLAAPINGNLRGNLVSLQTQPGWDLELRLTDTDIGAFSGNFPAKLSGYISSVGNLQDVRAIGQLEGALPELGQTKLEISSRFDGETLFADKLVVSTENGGKLNGLGQFTVGENDRRFQVEMDWQRLRWPLTGDEILAESPKGVVNASGMLSDYGYNLQLEASVPDIPSLTVVSQGRGNLESLQVISLVADLPKGLIKTRGSVEWSPRVAWDFIIDGEGLDPALFFDQLPGALALNAEVEGGLKDGILSSKVKLESLSGTLRDYPLNADGSVDVKGESVVVSNFRLNTGPTRIEANGSVGKQFDLDWSLDSPDLSSVWPGLAGMLNASGNVSGSATTPSVQASLKGGDLRYQDHRVSSVKGSLDLSMEGSETFKLGIDALGIESAGQKWTSVGMKGSGSKSEHRISLEFKGKNSITGTIFAHGGLGKTNVWQGQIEKLDIRVPKFGPIRLDKATQLVLGSDHMELGESCLMTDPGALCGSFLSDSDKGWKAEVNAEELDLGVVQPWLPARITLVGATRLSGKAVGSPQGLKTAELTLSLPKGEMTAEVGPENQKVDLSGSKVDAVLNAVSARADLDLPLGELGGLVGELTLPAIDVTNLDIDKQHVEGRVEGELKDLRVVSSLVPQVENVKGRVELDFKIAGSLAHPLLEGSADLLDAELDVPQIGLQAREIKMSVHAPDHQTVSYQGSVKSGEGRLNLVGETKLLGDKGFPTLLTISGKDWVAVDVPEAEVHVSPTLTLNHSADKSVLEGEIHIPYARVRPRELPTSAVKSTTDLVVVGEGAEELDHSGPRFHSKLRVIFGDRVSFEGFGVRGDLSGNLLLIDEPGRPVIGRGRVGIENGTYRAYGQDLKIERGYALFADSPVDNPGVDVKAQRVAGDITAGLQLTGTLKKPRMDLFSTPSMTQSEIISYLLTGKPSSKAGVDEDAVAGALAAGGAGQLTSELGRQMGLEELRMETGGSLDEASVVAGTYLSPRLYVQYVNELATRETILRMRYDLTDRIQIQTETGRAQGVDIFYTFER